VGVVGVLQSGVDAETRALLDTLVEQTAAALERANMSGEIIDTKAAAETEKVRNTLLASISHDFRTPLASILGSATSILDYGGKLDENAKRELLAQIKNEATHLDGMVRNLLSITRIDAGGLEVRKDWVDLREIIDRVVATARRAQSDHGISVSLPQDLPLVRADALLAEQAVGNVLQNAVSHTPPKTSVMISAEIADDRIMLKIADDGPGIAKDELAHVFDRFVSTLRPGSTRTPSDGVGLGLAIAKGIMQAHGGQIEVASPVMAGHGALFTLTFPRAKATP
jgi:two-component system sensor histidine kinase KdpD